LIIAALLLALGWPGCKKEEPRAEDAPSRTVPATGQTDESQRKDGRPRVTRMLDWIDPDAVGVGFMRLPEDLDVSALSVVFALPPRAERLLLDVARIHDDLDAILLPDAPRPFEWLGREALAMLPVMSAGTYVIRPITRPRAEVEQHLLAGGMQASNRDGFDMLFPTGAFPHKIAFLSDDLIAFIPVKEIGSGLSPLTAARDLPPSDLEREITTVLERERDALLEVYVQGPLIHLDLDQQLAGVRFALRDWGRGGLDGSVLLQPVRDPEKARDTLEKREAPHETNVVKGLVGRVAFMVEARFVTGRLQLTADDVRKLKEAK
jgi:hypothetical protein